MSTHNFLNLPPELDIEGDLTRSEAALSLSVEHRRYGKAVTLVHADGLSQQEVQSLAHRLKTHLGTGGTVHGGTIELQGDQRRKTLLALTGMGYAIKNAGP